MKIKDVENRINASYNTIKKFVEKDSSYYHKINNIIHVSDKGLEELENKYGLNSYVITDDNVDFYKNQISFLHKQLEENRKYNDFFVLQIENNTIQKDIDQKEIKKLETRNREIELENIELKLKLEQEKNKTIFQKIFGGKKNV